jgi:hypothetical protein
MILTASEVVASLSTRLGYWEYAEYASAFLVAVGCLGEYAADFTKWWTKGGLWKFLGHSMERRKEALEKRSTLLLMGALALELICLFSTNEISGRIIATLDNEAALANKRTAELQLLLGPRSVSLTKEKQKAIIDAVSDLKGIEADVFTFEGDEWTRFEAIPFASSLESTLDKAGLDMRGHWGTGCPMLQIYPLFGVSVISLPNASAREMSAVAKLQKAFHEAEIEETYFPREMPQCVMFGGLTTASDAGKPVRQHFANVRILVGYKPPTILNRPTVQDLNRPVTPP